MDVWSMLKRSRRAASTAAQCKCTDTHKRPGACRYLWTYECVHKSFHRNGTNNDSYARWLLAAGSRLNKNVHFSFSGEITDKSVPQHKRFHMKFKWFLLLSFAHAFTSSSFDVVENVSFQFVLFGFGQFWSLSWCRRRGTRTQFYVSRSCSHGHATCRLTRRCGSKREKFTFLRFRFCTWPVV